MWQAIVFGFLEEHGFRVVDSGTYRLGDWTLFGNGYAGIHIDSDGDTRSVQVKLMRLDDNQLPARWWDRQIPRVSLRLREVAEVLAPRSLIGESGLPPIEREADRAPHLRFWASALQAVAADWLHGDRTWFDNVEARLRGEDGQPASRPRAGQHRRAGQSDSRSTSSSPRAVRLTRTLGPDFSRLIRPAAASWWRW